MKKEEKNIVIDDLAGLLGKYPQCTSPIHHHSLLQKPLN